MRTVEYYLEQLREGLWLKGFLAFFVMIYVDVFNGDVLLFKFYIFFLGTDLVLGMLIAHIRGVFDPRYLLYWVRKLLTHMFLILIFGGLGYAAQVAASAVLNMVNWLLAVCILSECGSIINNLRRLGCPIPPPLEFVLKILRGRLSMHVTDVLHGDARMRQELEHLLAGRCKDGDGHE